MPIIDPRLDVICAELARIDGAAPGAGEPLSKHLKMALSPFRFLRGAAQLYYADLARGEPAIPAPLLEPPLTRVQGDCHFANFGFFTEEGSHGDHVVWGPNDFDDAAVGHAAFDLLRFGASLHLVADLCQGMTTGRYARDGQAASSGYLPPQEKDADRAVSAFVRGYRDTCAALVEDAAEHDRALDTFGTKHVLAGPLANARRRSAGGDRFVRKSTLGKSALLDAGHLRFRERPARFARLAPRTLARLARVFRPYVDDDILDVVERLDAGTGSVNMSRYYVLVGPAGTLAVEDLPLAHIVEVKQQREAALIHHFPDLSPINRLAPAHLTVDCQRQMMRRPDLILDELTWKRSQWLVRSRHHARLGFDPAALLGRKKPGRALREYAKACARTLAQAHARGDRRSTRFEAAMVAALDDASEELAALGKNYAARTISDHSLLREALGLAH